MSSHIVHKQFNTFGVLQVQNRFFFSVLLGITFILSIILQKKKRISFSLLLLGGSAY